MNKARLAKVSTLTIMSTSIALSIGAIATSFAWIRNEPTYFDLTFQTGDYPSYVNSNFHLRNLVKDEDGNNDIILGQVTGSDYNFKKISSASSRTMSINGVDRDLPAGDITVDFPALTYSFFDLFEQVNNENIDSNIFTLDVKDFYFAFMDFSFFKQYFISYVTGSMNFTISGNLGNNFVPDIYYSCVEDITNKDRNKMITNDSSDEISNSFISTLMDYGTNTPSLITSGTPINLFSGENQRAATSNPNVVDDELCYAYSIGYALFIDPISLFDFYKNAKESNVANPTISISATFEFILSDTEFTL